MDLSVQINFFPVSKNESLVINASSDCSLGEAFEMFAKQAGYQSAHELRFVDVNTGERLWADNVYSVRQIAESCRVGANMTAQIEVYPEIRAGKGGFGSMLRTIGAQIEKTTNREACRDLSGRRMRDVEREKRIRAAGVKKAKEKIDNMAKKKENAKKKLENIINSAGTSKDTILSEEPLIVTDVADMVDEDLAYFQATNQPKAESSAQESSAQASTFRVPESASKSDSSSSISAEESPQNTSPVGENECDKSEDKPDSSEDPNKDTEVSKSDEKPKDSASDSDSDDGDMGKNFWSGI